MAKIDRKAKKKLKRYVCGGCGQTILYTKNDVRVWNGRGGASRGYLDCPDSACECENKLWEDSADID